MAQTQTGPEGDSGSSFNLTKYDWSSGDLDYIGKNSNADASDDDPNWLIKKFTWSSGLPTVSKAKLGTWTGRAALF